MQTTSIALILAACCCTVVSAQSNSVAPAPRNDLLDAPAFLQIPGPNPILETAEAGSWDSGVLAPGESFTVAIDYEGRPQGACKLRTGGGSIDIRLPKDADVRVELRTSSGRISSDFDVDGYVSREEIEGTIGSGDGAQIDASTGAGNIDLISNNRVAESSILSIIAGLHLARKQVY